MLLQRLGAHAIPALSRRLTDTNTDMVIQAYFTRGSSGDASAVLPVRKLLYNEPQDANVRFAAYEALGLLPLHKGAFVQAEGLDDPVEVVRIAASRAIEHHTKISPKRDVNWQPNRLKHWPSSVLHSKTE